MKLIVSLALALVAQAGAVQTRKTPEPHQDDAQLVGHDQLKPNGAGGYSWHGDGFTASVASDGSVQLLFTSVCKRLGVAFLVNVSVSIR